jgi:hypothetical protein
MRGAAGAIPNRDGARAVQAIQDRPIWMQAGAPGKKFPDARLFCLYFRKIVVS